jgi:hypothetical protein
MLAAAKMIQPAGLQVRRLTIAAENDKDNYKR